MKPTIIHHQQETQYGITEHCWSIPSPINKHEYLLLSHFPTDPRLNLQLQIETPYLDHTYTIVMGLAELHAIVAVLQQIYEAHIKNEYLQPPLFTIEDKPR